MRTCDKIEDDPRDERFDLAAAETEKKHAAELDKAYNELKRTQAMLIQAEKLESVGRWISGTKRRAGPKRRSY